jgi:hypothetical protein
MTLLSSASLAADLRSRAPGRVALFSWDRAAERTIALYRSL